MDSLNCGHFERRSLPKHRVFLGLQIFGLLASQTVQLIEWFGMWDSLRLQIRHMEKMKHHTGPDDLMSSGQSPLWGTSQACCLCSNTMSCSWHKPMAQKTSRWQGKLVNPPKSLNKCKQTKSARQVCYLKSADVYSSASTQVSIKGKQPPAMVKWWMNACTFSLQTNHAPFLNTFNDGLCL